MEEQSQRLGNHFSIFAKLVFLETAVFFLPVNCFKDQSSMKKIPIQFLCSLRIKKSLDGLGSSCYRSVVLS